MERAPAWLRREPIGWALHTVFLLRAFFRLFRPWIGSLTRLTFLRRNVIPERHSHEPATGDGNPGLSTAKYANDPARPSAATKPLFLYHHGGHGGHRERLDSSPTAGGPATLLKAQVTFIWCFLFYLRGLRVLRGSKGLLPHPGRTARL